MKKKIAYLSLAILTSVISIFALGTTLSLFNAYSSGENIIVNWQTSDEVNLKEFVVQRKSLNMSYVEIGIIDAKGSNNYYTFVDENVFSKSTNEVFVYRLKLVNTNSGVGATYSDEITVSHNISSVKRTWGSIKALFR